MPNHQPLEPQEQKFTQWHNPTAHKVVADLYVGPSVPPPHRVRYVWQPGETRAVPSEFDNGIRQMDEQGRVIGGLAPHLRKVDEMVDPPRLPDVASPLPMVETKAPAAPPACPSFAEYIAAGYPAASYPPAWCGPAAPEELAKRDAHVAKMAPVASPAPPSSVTAPAAGDSAEPEPELNAEPGLNPEPTPKADKKKK